MKAKRAKQYRKLMHQYALSFNFREPYQVLLDASAIIAASEFKMRLGKMLQGTLHGEIKPMITQCCIRHLYTHPTTTDAERRKKEEWIQVAKEAERRRCGHHELDEPLSALECMKSVVDPKDSGTNRHRYVVASNELEVRKAMREIAGVPLIYMNRSVMILEPMAGKTEEVREREEKGKIRAGLKGRRGADAGAGEKRKREDDGDAEGGGDSAAEGEGAQAKKRRVKGPKGPNPLSVKKAKKEKKPVAREVEDERAVLRKQAKRDPQAGVKALDAGVAAVGEKTDGVSEGARKRKRKRKPKDAEDGMAGDGRHHEVE